jgi:hypothetical protein
MNLNTLKSRVKAIRTRSKMLPTGITEIHINPTDFDSLPIGDEGVYVDGLLVCSDSSVPPSHIVLK